jgi:hypothetical protein
MIDRSLEEDMTGSFQAKMRQTAKANPSPTPILNDHIIWWDFTPLLGESRVGLPLKL